MIGENTNGIAHKFDHFTCSMMIDALSITENMLIIEFMERKCDLNPLLMHFNVILVTGSGALVHVQMCGDVA